VALLFCGPGSGVFEHLWGHFCVAGTLTQLVKILSRYDYLFFKSFDKLNGVG
jgi:hypothetical protein